MGDSFTIFCIFIFVNTHAIPKWLLVECVLQHGATIDVLHSQNMYRATILTITAQGDGRAI